MHIYVMDGLFLHARHKHLFASDFFFQYFLEIDKLLSIYFIECVDVFVLCKGSIIIL
jgi:hypothetical protein